MTVWRLLGNGDVSKDLTPMYPLLSTEDEDVVYLALGQYYENRRKGKFVPTGASYLLTWSELTCVPRVGPESAY